MGSPPCEVYHSLTPPCQLLKFLKSPQIGRIGHFRRWKWKLPLKLRVLPEVDFPPLEWIEGQSNLINFFDVFIIFHLNSMCMWLKGSIPCQVAEANVTASMPAMPWWGE